MVKLIVIDLDGTLLNKEKIITQENFEAIRYAQNKGVVVAINTGRHFCSARYYALQLETKGPVISSNGAQISRAENGSPVYERPLPRETYSRIIKAGRKLGIQLTVYVKGSILAETQTATIDFYQRDSLKLTDNLKYDIKVVPDLLTDETVAVQPVFKVEIDRLTGDLVEKFLQSIKGIEGIAVVDCLNGSIEITEKSCDKASGMRILADSMGIRDDEIMAVGDSPNDVEMLRKAGVSYVMGNAKEAVRRQFSNVTGTNTDSGVAKAIYKEIQ